MNKIKSVLTIIFCGGFIVVMFFLCVFHRPQSFSASEKRRLASFPELSIKNVIDGNFMAGFESYGKDQIPFRYEFREMAAVFSMDVMGRKDNHGLYQSGDSILKMDYPLKPGSVAHAADRFKYVYEQYLSEADCNIFVSVIPDKVFYDEDSKIVPKYDFKKLEEYLTADMPYAEYIDITDTLDMSCFYSTDPHWRQEKIRGTAERILAGLGQNSDAEQMQSDDKEQMQNDGEKPDDYEIIDSGIEYRGTYLGQSAFTGEGESLFYITNSIIEKCEVTNYENNLTTGVYDFDKLHGMDPYEMYLSGSVSLLKITTNRKSGLDAEETCKRLIIFRDSFTSSIAPYFTGDYDEIILIDIRYIAPEYLGRFVSFEDADVLLLYSSSVLNHSETIK